MELTDHIVHTVRNEIFSSNSYILQNKLSDFCLLIDPGLDARAIDKKLTELNLRPIAILSTHGHFDHIGSASFFKKKFKIPFYLHESDLKISQSANFYLKIAQVDHKIETPSPDVLLKGAHERIILNSFHLDIYNFPGHSPGSCIIKIDHYLFSGDIIYKNGLGNGSMPKENSDLLKQSILNIFSVFDDGDLVLPGHGAPEFMGLIKLNNTELKNYLFLKK